MQGETCGDRSRDFKLLYLSVSFPSLSRLSVVVMHRRLFMAVFPTLLTSSWSESRCWKGNQAECWEFVYRHIGFLKDSAPQEVDGLRPQTVHPTHSLWLAHYQSMYHCDNFNR